MAAEARRRSRTAELCVAGSIVANRPAMDRLKADSPAGFFVAPAAGAAQRAAGAALLGSRRTFHTPRPRPGSQAPSPAASLPLAQRTAADTAFEVVIDLALGAVYYLGFDVYSLPLRLLGFEFLEERFGLASYWRSRPKEGEGMRAYRRRF